jgi:hypothetical protein
MLLYHGTTGEVARKALVEGLRPRVQSGNPGNWKATSESREDLVYLTVAYAGYFAGCAASAPHRQAGRFDDPWGFIEVDTALLGAVGQGFFVPDEDYLEQGTRRTPIPRGSFWKGLKRIKTMKGRTGWFRQRLSSFSDMWDQSIEGLGNCAYFGGIPPEAITRIVVYDPKSNPSMTIMALDPMISLINFQICGGKYRALTRWFMGYEVKAEDVSLFPAGGPFAEQIQQLGDVMKNRDGLTILKG